ncbi:MAG: glycosyltransferase [Bacillota bacterium]|nr:glycosyltransferase [Bacillota bacterium]
MKVLLINSVSGIKSTGRICTDLADALIETGHECRIAYGREHVPERYRTISYRIGSDFDVFLHGLQSRIFDNTGFGSRKATVPLIDWIKAYDPDIIHLHNLHGYYINIEVLFNYLKEAGKPVVWTLHDCWPFTGHCAHFDFVGCEKWKMGCFQCPQKGEYPTSYVFDSSKQNYQRKKELFTSLNNLTVVTPSNWLAGLVKQSFLSKYPVQVIHNGIDLEQFKPTPSKFRVKHGIENKVMLLGIASVWNHRKGLNTFLELAEMLDDHYVIVLAGLSKKQLDNLPKNIIGIQRTDSVKELAEIYTAADVFINPTMEDNYPTVNLEALACGTPVIFFNTGGNAETIKANTGIATETRDAEGIVKVINSDFWSKIDVSIETRKHLDKNLQNIQYISLFNSFRLFDLKRASC